jgi:hypothetical protein
MAHGSDLQPPWTEPDLWNDNLRRTAEALGFLVIMWADLEDDINQFVMKLLEQDRLHYEVVGHIDFRGKIQITKSTTFTFYHPSKWFDDVERIINIIDNELRPERNRMMHDQWHRHGDPDSPLIRRSFTPRLRKPQARQRILHRDVIPISDGALWQFCLRVLSVSTDFGALMYRIPKRASRGKLP